MVQNARMKKTLSSPKQLTKYGRALLYLLDQTDLNQNKMCQKAGLAPNEFYRMCRGERGSGPRQFERVFEAMGFTWHDWAKAVDVAEGKKSPATVQKDTPVSKWSKGVSKSYGDGGGQRLAALEQRMTSMEVRLMVVKARQSRNNTAKEAMSGVKKLIEFLTVEDKNNPVAKDLIGIGPDAYLVFLDQHPDNPNYWMASWSAEPNEVHVHGKTRAEAKRKCEAAIIAFLKEGFAEAVPAKTQPKPKAKTQKPKRVKIVRHE